MPRLLFRLFQGLNFGCLDAGHQRFDFVIQLPVGRAADDGRRRFQPGLLPDGDGLLHQREAARHGVLQRTPILADAGLRMHALLRLLAQRPGLLVCGEVRRGVGQQVAPLRGLRRLELSDDLLQEQHGFTRLGFALRPAEQRIDGEVGSRDAQDDQHHPGEQGDVDGRAKRRLHGA
jgi:hypothetical protein